MTLELCDVGLGVTSQLRAPRRHRLLRACGNRLLGLSFSAKGFSVRVLCVRVLVLKALQLRVVIKGYRFDS